MEARPEPATGEQEEWDEENDYEEEDDADIDAEAIEIARRLGEELWADISKVNAERNAAASRGPSSTAITAPPATLGPAPAVSLSHQPRKEEAIIATMQGILALVESDPPAKAALASTNLPNGTSVLALLLECSARGSIAHGIAGPLSQIIVALARSNALFGNLKQSNASAIELDKGKRKREEFDEGHHLHLHAFKRPYVPDVDFHNQVVEAVRTIAQALGASASQTLDPALVSSIRLQLHQVFLFAVTSSTGGGPSMHALQEISGLIQVIGVLSGIQIGQSPGGTLSHPPGQPFPHGATYPWSAPMATDIGTAVYPCLVVGCHKIFSRLYSLRAHQRSHASHRPYRCNICPASFARNHDLKRHIKVHDKKAWKCEGCQKIFSRRDAIKRHKTGTKHRGPRSEICLAAEVIEVELEGEAGQDVLREERRAKIWNGIVVQEASGAANAAAQNMGREMKTIDEGEINPAVIAGMQASVLSLHSLLQALVGNTLGNPLGQPMSAPVESSGGQATLASIIARAQSQNNPSTGFVPSPFGGQPPAHQMPTNAAEPALPAAEETPSQAQPVGENLENHQPVASLSMYGLSDEQAHLLEIAIANAASAAQAQAEAEAALEEEEEDYDPDEYDGSDMDQDKKAAPLA